MNVAFVSSLSKKYGPPTHHTSGERDEGRKRRAVTGSRTDPLHMPVTRDLSSYHQSLMLSYLQSLISGGRSTKATKPIA